MRSERNVRAFYRLDNLRQLLRACPACQGTGRHWVLWPCDACHGSGRLYPEPLTLEQEQEQEHA